jgi:hypothetical protein
MPQGGNATWYDSGMRLRLALLLLIMSPLGSAAADPARTSHALGALPGVYRVATAEPDATGVAVYTSGGYGYAAGVLGGDDVHHRINGGLAVSLRALPWLAAGLRLDGRRDQHTGLASIDQEDDDGMVGEPRLLVQAGTSLSDALHAGLRLTAWLPGNDAPSVVLGATTVDALAMFTLASPGGALRLGLNAGFRLDRSAASVADADLLSQSDRLGLGVSDSNAVLAGLGAAYRMGSVELLGELTMDRLLGADAPAGLRGSPLRVAAGVRVPLGRNLAAELVAESNLARLPTAEAGQPLVPYEPRLSITAGVHYRFGGGPARAATTGAGAGTGERPAPEQPAAPRLAALRGRVQGAGGTAVPSAAVTIEAGGASREITVDAEARFRVDDLPPGPVSVAVRAEGFEPATRSIELAAGADQELVIELERVLPPGQLRGFVRSFGGKPVAAELTIEPLGKKITAGADGGFQIDVAPGKYEVVIRAPGYREQRRSVTIEEGGVLILNVDLRAQK